MGAALVNLPRFLNPELVLTPRSTVETLQYSIFRDAAVNLFLMLIPISIGVAILRYRLWNIDLIINRTLVYVPLSAILAGAYAATVGFFQRLFVAVTGEKSDAAIVLSTLVIASTFTPIKNGVQALVDRRFKEAPDAAGKLKELVKQLDGSVWQVNREVVTRRLLDEAVAAFEAEGGAIYLRSNGVDELVHTAGEWEESEASARVPLEYEGETLGILKLGQRREQESYSRRDYKVLEEAASAVASALAQSETRRVGSPAAG
jgi:hypothetical protein